MNNITLNCHNNLLTTKNWKERAGNTAICMLAVRDSKHIGHGWCWEGLATVLIGGEGSDGSVDGVWECCQKRKGCRMVALTMRV